jgi:hypothetical protein
LRPGDSWEMVQIPVNPGETYEIYVYSYGFFQPSTYFGLAWAVDSYN